LASWPCVRPQKAKARAMPGLPLAA